MNNNLQETDNGQNLFSVMAKLCVQIGDLTTELKNSRKKLEYRRHSPIYYTYSDVVTTNAAGFGVIRLAGPDQGDVWYVAGIGVWGEGASGVETQVTGVADIFISAMDYRSITNIAMMNPADWRDSFRNLPNVGQFGRGRLVLRFNEELFIVIYGGPANTQFGAVVWTLNFQEADMREGVII